MNKNIVIVVMVFVALLLNVVSAETAERVKYNGKILVLDRMVSQFSTQFNVGNKNRSENIRVAKVATHGLVIMPNQVVSANKVIGPRIPERGFKEATAFANGQIVPSIGGGVCQLVSTLCGASIKLNLKIIQRHRHSRPVSYVSSEYEATVAWGTKDFVFQNNTDKVLFVKCLVRSNNIIVEYWRCSVEEV